MTQLKLPDVGDNIEKGTVVAVLVNEGDTITEGQSIVELETDKAVVEVPSSAAGVVSSIAVKVGDTLAVGGVIAELSGSESATSDAPKADAPKVDSASGASAAASEIVVNLPDVGDNIEKGTVVAVLVGEGDTVTEGQSIVELETDKAVVEVPSSAAGVVSSIAVKVGDSVAIGAPLLTLKGEAGSSAPAAVSASEPAPVSVASTQPAPNFNGRATIPAAPSVRRLARELGVDLNTVTGSGAAGRITEEDVRRVSSGGAASSEKAPAASVAAPTPVSTPTVSAAPLPDFGKWGNITREDMSGIRKATVRSMTASTAIPMVTHFDKADITVMEETRKRFAARVEKAGGKLTMTHILMKVVAGALRQFPKFGASLDLAAEQVIYKDYVNLGVAVDTPVGLLVPVIKNADQKSITEMVLELSDLAARARDRKLKPDEMQGATFTISNLGGIGGHAFTPIVNSPEVAILGVSRGGFEPVWNKEKGEFEPRNMLPISLSYDHRLIDGADAARFVRFICESLEDPFLISL